MSADFTYERYAELLKTCGAQDVPTFTVREYLTADTLPDQFVILRHDVDRKPGNALDFARIEAAYGVQSTYYVRTVEETFDPELLRELEALGHEVGYHYEDLDRADGDTAGARLSFVANLARMRQYVTVDTVCMHGNPLTPHDNRDMWGPSPAFGQHDLLGEAYLSMDFTDVLYYSDTGRTWLDGTLKIKDHTVGAARDPPPARTTGDLQSLVTETDEPLCLLTHPDRWAGGGVERLTETAFDTAKNVAKYGLQAASGDLR